ncbi:siderophore ABC transporter substrate-binding protein [Sphaerimonospora thailandensis]|uniref:Putative ABC transporter solute-binding protein YclQ n=1 Tax=Sphaerimonospora thailandensis TaxID=795644 RepID=A0A8J3VYE3_9ACTN|nr:siderophore ABC transporter substrate-binding protein [Sphaerimonospora thailandensis]GIH68913.1 putative ABC transporter solute-binding protein YclQ [Sphaerimonospora thailandensis]
MHCDSLRHRLLGALVIPALFVLAACGSTTAPGSGDSAASSTAASSTSAEPVTITHAQGTATIPSTPSKVVVFDIGVLVTLDELDVPVAGVPQLDTLPDSLAKYRSDDYAKVGSLKEPDYEKVAALGPDLIIVAGRSSAAYPELNKIARTVDLTVDNENFLSSFRQRTEALGAIFGKRDQVKQRLDALEASVNEVAAKAPAKGTGLVVLTTGGKMSAYGPGSRFGIVYDPLGVRPAVDDLSTDAHGNAISAELLAKADPDLLYVVDRDAAIGESGKAAEQVLDNELVKQTKAAKNNKIFYLDSFTWYVAPGGLSSVEAMIKAIGDSLS